jgi:hypothetical protein
MFQVLLRSLLLAITMAQAGCETTAVTSMASNSSMVKQQLEVVSAGHTGCMPEENEVAIVWAKADGSGRSTWR